MARRIVFTLFFLLAVLVTTLAWSGMSLREIFGSLFGS
jgi:hypothetical protein